MSSCGESFRKGQWSLEEDECLKASVALLGESRWDAIAKATGLKRSGKSCRLRWLNYLQPNLKHSPISIEEEQIILRLHQKWGNKWARIARSLPGRTDNEIKNYWRGCLRKKKTTQSIDQSSSKAKTLQRTCVCSSWNSDADERDYNDVIKEISLQEDKSKEASPCSGALTTSDFDELPKLLVMNPESPYQNHFSNWVSLFPGENVDQFMSSYFQRDMDAAGWSWEETSDCWDMNLFTSTEL